MLTRSLTVIPADYSTQLTHLLRYPSSATSLSSSTPSIHPCILLLRQALTLQMSAIPATGAAIVQENDNLLGIPTEVPDTPPPNIRRRPGNRNQSYSASEAEASSRGAGSSGAHFRQGSASIGLPEMIARGLLERGESLGINKTVMNAVSELKVLCPSLLRT
jgi:TBC1 domain family member 5